MRIVVSVVAALASATPALAQGPRPVPFGRPTATYAEPFSRILGLRELSDGRVLISDNLEKTVAILDLRSGALTPVGREGAGPGEYQSPASLYALPGDTTLLMDFGNFRGLVIAPGGAVGRTIPLQRGQGLLFFIPRAADAEGRLYGESPVSFRQGDVSFPDSAALLRLDWRRDVVDTVAWMPRPDRGGPTSRLTSSGGAAVRMSAPQPFQPMDAWTVAPDGRVAIVRADPYRVEWLGAGRPRAAGPVLPYEPVRIGKAEKEAWAERRSSSSVRMVVGGSGGGGRTLSMPRPNIDEVDWPETMPPFEAGGVAVSPAGEVWIRTSAPAHAKAAVYDVVGAQGRLVARVQLPDGRRLVGFGRGTAYLVYQDEDDLQWLERYAMPPGR